MAHYARLAENSIVEEVVVVNSVSVNEDDETAVNVYLAECGMPGTWKRCSYNTILGKHVAGGTPFRGTYPGPGSCYDAELDMFVPLPRPSADAVFDTDTYSWIVESDGEE